MTFVVDASVALKWVLKEDDSDIADALLDERLIAPTWWRVEVANGLWKAARKGLISTDEADDRLAVLLDMSPVEDIDPADVVARATRLAHRLKHPVYDLLYLVAAIDAGSPLVTADVRFMRVLSGEPDLAARLLTLEAWGGLKG
ncbi:type II toxin-antitoxin system VapC family toxin [Brevundimonas sp.]|jgi:predicted nucleic acid-binding protein|uniref:type II toxin-antitoxin system VapC family toxin n=1 Tax=Brevundimonas sp. TaxID=1871086 RepID=UPI0037BF46CA